MSGFSQTQTQTLSQQQQQQLSQMQVLVARLTELPLEGYRQRVENELVENPYLEKTSSEDDDYSSSNDEGYSDGNGEDYQDYDSSKDYANDDDIPDYAVRQDNGIPEQDRMEYGDSLSFYDQLIEQVSEYNLSEHDETILKYLIGSLDDDGLLRKPLYQIVDELDVYNNCPTTEEEVERVLTILWNFDPAGVGGRCLQECLLIQVKRNVFGNTAHQKIIRDILQKEWDDVTHNRWDRIQQNHQLTDLELEDLRRDFHRLNPRPGSAMGEKESKGSQHVTPDFTVEVNPDGQIDLTLNEGDVPTLSISEDAKEMMSDSFVKGYVEKGKLFINAMLQRRQTMLKTMQAIIKLQRPYFLDGDEESLRPMKLEDIAEITHQDLSTISRVTGSKYVETPYGILPLKWFFSSAVSKNNGENTASSRQLQKAISDLVENEDKKSPLSDDAICQALNQQGFDVARRTVAKYREQLGIPTSRMRRK